jgi:hypothetical protein
MPYGESNQPGVLLWFNTTPITVAGSPLLSPWLNTHGLSRIFPWFSFAGGTSTHTIEGSFDGATADADLVLTPTTDTEFNVRAPFIRWRTVQTVADSTKSKVTLRGVASRIWWKSRTGVGSQQS